MAGWLGDFGRAELDQIATAEANSQAAINALEMSAQPNTPLATAITNPYLNDYLLRAAMATQHPPPG